MLADTVAVIGSLDPIMGKLTSEHERDTVKLRKPNCDVGDIHGPGAADPRLPKGNQIVYVLDVGVNYHLRSCRVFGGECMKVEIHSFKAGLSAQ